MTLRIRELPPLRHSVEIETPGGRAYRWAGDEPDARNVPTGLKHESSMPGGYATSDCSLARRPEIDFGDLERLSTKRVRDATGGIVSETRLERAPATSGDRLVISPSAVGWQANLEDDKFAHVVIMDRDISRFQGMSRQRHVDLGGNVSPQNDGQVTPDATTGAPALKLEVSGHIAGSSGGRAEAWYDAGDGNLLGALHVESSDLNNVAGGAPWVFKIEAHSSDTAADAVTVLADVAGASAAFQRLTVSPARRWLRILLSYGAAYTADENERWRMVKNLAVIGSHGLTVQQRGAGLDGILASDIVRYAVDTFAQRLRTTSESIAASAFVIPHMDPFIASNAGEMVRQATRFGLEDWAVWDDRTFWWHPRGAHGRSWRARIAPSQLEEVGPQVDGLWNSVVVQHQDVDGSTRTVGPTDSGAGVEDAALEDADPENPANRAGVTRRALLTMGTSTSAGAIEVGRRFLEEQKLLDSSGQARFVGHVEDDRGVMHPFSHVRAGDTVTFIDARDTSSRRIVRASHDHDSRTCTVDIDSPPEGLDALLERLGVVLVPLGL